MGAEMCFVLLWLCVCVCVFITGVVLSFAVERVRHRPCRVRCGRQSAAMPVRWRAVPGEAHISAGVPVHHPRGMFFFIIPSQGTFGATVAQVFFFFSRLPFVYACR